MTQTPPDPQAAFGRRPVSPPGQARSAPAGPSAPPLIGGGAAGRPIPTDRPAKRPAATHDATKPVKAVSVWMPDGLRRQLDATIPGVHRRSLVMVAYDRHHTKMYTRPMRRPGPAPPGTRSRNWTVRVYHDEHRNLQALAQHLRWPTAAVIRKLLELEVAWEKACGAPEA